MACVLATSAVAGCGSAEPPRPRAIDGVFPAQGDVARLPVRVTDLPGVIRAVSIAADAGDDGVSQVPGRDDALYVQWRGGTCDRDAEVIVDRIGAGLLVTIRSKHDLGGCFMDFVTRTLMLELNEPVAASTVTLELQD